MLHFYRSFLGDEGYLTFTLRFDQKAGSVQAVYGMIWTLNQRGYHRRDTVIFFVFGTTTNSIATWNAQRVPDVIFYGHPAQAAQL
jgi:hypothetical protein